MVWPSSADTWTVLLGVGGLKTNNRRDNCLEIRPKAGGTLLTPKSVQYMQHAFPGILNAARAELKQGLTESIGVYDGRRHCGRRRLPWLEFEYSAFACRTVVGFSIALTD